jgi:hypothetical protein
MGCIRFFCLKVGCNERAPRAINSPTRFPYSTGYVAGLWRSGNDVAAGLASITGQGWRGRSLSQPKMKSNRRSLLGYSSASLRTSDRPLPKS